MRFDTIFVLFFISLTLLGVVHKLAVAWSLYWIYPWFDNPMHFLGGATIALGAQTELFSRIFFVRPRRVWYVLGIVLAVGVIWEIFEWQVGITLPFGVDMFDTLSDLFFDIAGGVVGYIVGASLIRNLEHYG